jgi:hypothetical protein
MTANAIVMTATKIARETVKFIDAPRQRLDQQNMPDPGPRHRLAEMGPVTAQQGGNFAGRAKVRFGWKADIRFRQ